MHFSSYSIAHWLRDSMPFVWNSAERCNAWWFQYRFACQHKQIEQDAFQMAVPYRMERISDISADELAAFFHSQPDDIYRWFTPHGFESEDIITLQNNRSFLAYVLKQEGQIVAYFFLRCFCNGTCYFGRMVDYRYRNQGIGKLINKLSFFMSEAMHLKSYQTISNQNIASIKSCSQAYRLEPLGTTANGDILYKNCPL